MWNSKMKPSLPDVFDWLPTLPCQPGVTAQLSFALSIHRILLLLDRTLVEQHMMLIMAGLHARTLLVQTAGIAISCGFDWCR